MRKNMEMYDTTGAEVDTVREYLKEINKFSLLTADEEFALGERIRAGKCAEKFIKQLKEQMPAVTDARAARELQDMLETQRAIAEDGKTALKQLTEANLRLVVSIAKRYVGHGLSLLDLIQEGNLGLMKAADKFDHTKGFKFSTYACGWIRQAITRGITNQGSTIRLPIYKVDFNKKVNRIQQKLIHKYGCEPTLEEIAGEMELPAEYIEDSISSAKKIISYDAPIGEDDAIMMECLKDHNAANPFEEAAGILLREHIATILDQLPEREAQVIMLRYGLDGKGERTLEQVSRLMETPVTRERIRQIENKALARIRCSEYMRSLLEDYAS